MDRNGSTQPQGKTPGLKSIRQPDVLGPGTRAGHDRLRGHMGRRRRRKEASVDVISRDTTTPGIRTRDALEGHRGSNFWAASIASLAHLGRFPERCDGGQTRRRVSSLIALSPLVL